MNRHRRRAACVAMAGAGALALGAASAEALPFSVATSGVPTQTLSFEKFDALDGTLTGVVFSLGGSSTSSTSGIQLTGSEGGTAAASMSASFQIAGPDDSGPLDIILFDATGSASTSCSASGEGPDDSCSNSSTSTSVSPPFPSQVTISDTLDLASYSGVGFFDVPVSVAILTNLVTQCESPSFSQPTCTPSAEALWSGELTVSFRFDEVSEPPPGGDLPEPATLALLGLGLAGLAFARRQSARL